MLSYLTISQGIDWEGNFSACLFDWGNRTLSDDSLQHLVVKVPFTQTELMAKNFNLTAEQFSEGEIHHLKERINRSQDAYVCRQGKSGLLCLTKEVLEKYLKSDSSLSDVSSDPEERLSKADFLFHVNVDHFRPDQFDKQMERDLDTLLLGQPDETRKRAFEVINHINHGFFAANIDEGMHLRFQLSLDKELPAASQKLLSQWGTPVSVPSLKGFPNGQLIFGMSKTAGEIKNSQLLQQIALWIFKRSINHRSLVELVEPYLSPQNETFYGVIDELWNSIVEARSAVYKNENPTIDGLANLLIILKPEDQENFSQRLAELIKFSRGTVYKPNQNEPEPVTDQDIKMLVEELGATEFKKRAAATLRLKLLGERSLPHLVEALVSTDIEVAGRSKRLVTFIKKEVANHTENLLKEGLTVLPMPKFVYYENQRQIAGHRTDLLEAVWEGEHSINEKRLQELVGPHGHEILLVHVKDEVVLFWGSNRKILEECVKLLENGQPALEVHRKQFANYALPRRLIEVHASLQQLTRMVPDAIGRKPKKPSPPITQDYSSFGFEVAPTHLIGDATFPIAEYRFLWRYFFF
ncbi:MAG: hypothetical protein P8M30_01935 [Planctomycetaceae bacterium]|nr:hypothetical protein [Planctomycetaceae bacterium]